MHVDDRPAYLKALGAKVKMAREMKEMSQLDVANAADTKRAMVAKIENGESDPSISLFVRIANALSVKATLLLP